MIVKYLTHRIIRLNFLGLALASSVAIGQDPTTSCHNCAEWSRPQEPFLIFGNTYYVGTHGLSSILITSKGGHVLIDGALPQSAKQIAGSVRALGFRLEDVKVILNSHVHYDHAGGIAELQRLSGARVMASSWSAAVLRTGRVGRGDPQFAGGVPIARVSNVSELHDGEQIEVGDVSLTAHLTPGHTPGGTSWTWKSCEGPICREIVYADSLTPVSSGSFRFSDGHEYPEVLHDFENSFAFLQATPCDILITTHPEASALWERIGTLADGKTQNSLVNSAACREFAERSREQLQERLAKERSEDSRREHSHH